jgi:hypothetical protein
MWTTPSLVFVGVGPYNKHMMQSCQLGYANATATAMVPDRLSSCVMQGNLEMAPTLPLSSPCMGCAPHLPNKAHDIHPGINIATFTHLLQTQANTVKFTHQELFNPKIFTQLKATQKGFLKGFPSLNKTLIVKYLNPSIEC